MITTRIFIHIYLWFPQETNYFISCYFSTSLLFTLVISLKKLYRASSFILFEILSQVFCDEDIIFYETIYYYYFLWLKISETKNVNQLMFWDLQLGLKSQYTGKLTYRLIKGPVLLKTEFYSFDWEYSIIKNIWTDGMVTRWGELQHLLQIYNSNSTSSRN